MSGSFTALGHRDFRKFWFGSVIATTAFMMSFMLVPSVAYAITGKNASAGLAQMGAGIGMFASRRAPERSSTSAFGSSGPAVMIPRGR